MYDENEDPRWRRPARFFNYLIPEHGTIWLETNYVIHSVDYEGELSKWRVTVIEYGKWQE